jgi:hypothetical protein
MDLKQAILEYKTGSEVIVHFADELTTKGNFQDNPPKASDAILVPEQTMLENGRDWKGHYEKWYDGNFKSF